MSVSTSQVTTANMQGLISLFEDLSCHFRIRVHTTHSVQTVIRFGLHKIVDPNQGI